MAGRQHGSGEKAHAQAQRRGRRRRSFFLLLSGRQAGTLEKPWLVLLTPEQEISRDGKEERCSRMSREDAVQKRPHLFSRSR